MVDMLNQFSRTELLFGKEAMERLRHSRVAVFGMGGVGSYTAEALARSGIGTIDIFDDDKVCLTNLNRQIIATHKSIGRYKIDVMKERILDINPQAVVYGYPCFYGPDVSEQYDFSIYSYIVDAIDTVSGKIELVLRAKEKKIPIISSMGAGNKLDPTQLMVEDIYKTSICPLARVMRRELKKRGVDGLKVVYSKEAVRVPIEETAGNCKTECICPPGTERKCGNRRQIPGSNSFVPSVAGLIMAGEVIKDLTGIH